MVQTNDTYQLKIDRNSSGAFSLTPQRLRALRKPFVCEWWDWRPQAANPTTHTQTGRATAGGEVT